MVSALSGRPLPLRRLLAGLLGLLLVVAVTACDSEADREPGGQHWPTGESLDASGLVWGKGHTIHLADGTEIDTVDDFSEYAVAGDAVWFTKAAASDPTQPAENGRLYRATRDGVEATDSYVTQISATTDGRHLVLLDDVNGPKDDHGTAAFLLVVVDTETGEETIRTAEGMDDPGGVGLAEAYEEGSPWLAAVTDTTAYVSALGEHRAFDLATGEVEEVSSDDVPDPQGEPTHPRWNGSHTWRIDIGQDGSQPGLVDEAGHRIDPELSTSEWALVRWLDDDTVLAISMARVGSDGDDGIQAGDVDSLATCEVPSGACTQVPGATRDLVSEPPLFPQQAIRTGVES
ncbi:hypothetical protein ncot_14960 [Nocardioides sp. JQ2195]|uniref:hypothetical protein n=1 Tax=Nocardioides sp. JQ2195 TaxID=2592334 RepID=UPI00143EA550|nr:hypothetical protein [Nocardioides sp. JQ2195]QIX27750.1 hypothetical protein ncot_14960 [Nocardioides sp. JQ2195]